jgi:hypothetical protein
LRLRSFTLGTKLADDDVVGAGGLEGICSAIRAMEPFVSCVDKFHCCVPGGSQRGASGGMGRADESLWKRPRGGDPDAMHALAVQAGRLRTRAAAQTDGVGKSGIGFSWKRWG